MVDEADLRAQLALSRVGWPMPVDAASLRAASRGFRPREERLPVSGGPSPSRVLPVPPRRMAEEDEPEGLVAVEGSGKVPVPTRAGERLTAFLAGARQATGCQKGER